MIIIKIGTKSLLFGCHQFIIHPVTVYIAWKKLYKLYPSFGETIAIVIHDWGYLGKSNLDGKEGSSHPEWAHNFFLSLRFNVLGNLISKNPNNWYDKCNYLAELCLYHSRFYCEKNNKPTSKLCWADKYGSVLMGKKLWALTAYISGEGKEYMQNSKFEIYTDESKDNGLYTWYDDYVEFIMPVIYENVELMMNGSE